MHINESMKVTKTNLTNKVVLGSVTSKTQKKKRSENPLRDRTPDYRNLTKRWFMCRVKLNKAIKMIVDLLPLSANHHQQGDKLTFGAINAFLPS